MNCIISPLIDGMPWFAEIFITVFILSLVSLATIYLIQKDNVIEDKTWLCNVLHKIKQYSLSNKPIEKHSVFSLFFCFISMMYLYVFLCLTIIIMLLAMIYSTYSMLYNHFSEIFMSHYHSLCYYFKITSIYVLIMPMAMVMSGLCTIIVSIIKKDKKLFKSIQIKYNLAKDILRKMR